MKQLSLIYTGKNFECSQTQKITYQKILRYSTNAHRHNSKLRWLDADMLSVVPEEGNWQCHSSYLGSMLTLKQLVAKETLNGISLFILFGKSQNLLWISFG